MEMHQLRYVIAVARARNFSRAAEQCHVSQPSLSQQIQKLEDELGERLFNRTRREAVLTPSGESFLRRAIRIMDEVEGARREATDARDVQSGTVSAGVLPTIAPYLLPMALTKFTRKFPGVEVIVQEETTAQLLKLVQNCEINFAVASHPIQDSRLEVRELFTEELLLALPATHRLARKNVISIAEVEKEPFIVMKDGHCLGDQVLRFCDRRNLRPNITFRSAQLETIQSLVRSGLGLSLIPKMATKDQSNGGPKYRPLSAPRPQRKIVAFWLKRCPPNRAARAFLEVIAASSKSQIQAQ